MTTGQAAAAAGVSAYTLRYYEDAGLIPPPARDDAGRRVYTEIDMAWLDYALCLRRMGMGVAEIAEYVDAATRPGGTSRQMELLRGHVAEMRSQRERLDNFIEIAEAKLAANSALGSGPASDRR